MPPVAPSEYPRIIAPQSKFHLNRNQYGLSRLDSAIRVANNLATSGDVTHTERARTLTSVISKFSSWRKVSQEEPVTLCGCVTISASRYTYRNGEQTKTSIESRIRSGFNLVPNDDKQEILNAYKRCDTDSLFEALWTDLQAKIVTTVHDISENETAGSAAGSGPLVVEDVAQETGTRIDEKLVISAINLYGTKQPTRLAPLNMGGGRAQATKRDDASIALARLEYVMGKFGTPQKEIPIKQAASKSLNQFDTLVRIGLKSLSKSKTESINTCLTKFSGPLKQKFLGLAMTALKERLDIDSDFNLYLDLKIAPIIPTAYRTPENVKTEEDAQKVFNITPDFNKDTVIMLAYSKLLYSHKALSKKPQSLDLQNKFNLMIKAFLLLPIPKPVSSQAE